jgi:hypothetical protein
LTKYTVYFTKSLSTRVDVEVDDDTDEDEVVDLAYEKLGNEGPPSLCAYCVGFGQPWNQDDGGDWELDGEPEEQK